MNLFDFNSYLEYLKTRLQRQSGPRRGLKTQFADAIGCDGAYVSRILDGTNHLSLEQGMRANHYFAHTEDESEYFLTLISLARAGSKELQAHFKKKRSSQQEANLRLSHRLRDFERLDLATQSHFYSHWLYVATDMATSIPKLQSLEAMASYFALPRATLIPILEFLEKAGIVKRDGELWVNTRRQMHIGTESPFLTKHHLNWRLKAMQAIELGRKEDLHYSSVISVSSQDIEKIKKKLLDTITEIRALVKDSKDETVASYCVDLFELGASR